MSRLSTKWKVALGIAGVLVLAGIVGALTGNAGRNNAYQPQEEFKLDPWIPIHLGKLDLSINKGVLYIFLASVLTVLTMTWIARRMAAKPNLVQTAVEQAYILMRDNITQGNMDRGMAAKWFPFVGALFLFIWFSNVLGYLPLPTGHDKVDILGLQIPAFALYAATANISVPLILTLVVWFSYQVEGVREHGVGGYLSSWIPEGVTGPAKAPIFVIEVISQFVRIISLSVRLFANILAGHLLILFMGGGLVILLGIAAVGVFTLPVAIVFYIFELGLIATLQAFIFATLTAIYLGGATAGH